MSFRSFHLRGAVALPVEGCVRLTDSPTLQTLPTCEAEVRSQLRSQAQQLGNEREAEDNRRNRV